MSSTPCVWVITHSDHDHYEEDPEGRTSVLGVHATLKSANNAARIALDEDSEVAGDNAEIDVRHNKDGGLETNCRTLKMTETSSTSRCRR